MKNPASVQIEEKENGYEIIQFYDKAKGRI